METKNQAKVPVVVNVSVKGQPKVSIMVSDLGYSEIISSIQSDEHLCWYTNYNLETKDGIITHTSTFDGINENEILDIQLVPLNNNEGALIEHAKHFLRIVFILTEMHNMIDCSQSVIGSILRSIPNDNQTVPVEDFSQLYPHSYSNYSSYPIISHFDLVNSSVSLSDHFIGILQKFNLRTHEGEEFIVKGSETGWFVKNEKVFSSLHMLIADISSHFRDNYLKVSKKWCSLIQCEKNPFSPLMKVQTILPSQIKNQDRPKLKLFSGSKNSLLSTSLDDSIELIGDEDYKDILISSVEDVYIKDLLDGISQIKRGLIPPINENRNYIWNDLFISHIGDLSIYFEGRGGVETAHKVVSNEIRIYPVLKKKIKNAKVVRTFVIDLFNERWMAQTLIPGLLKGKAQIVYGFPPGNKATFQIPSEFSGLFEDIAPELSISPSIIKGVDSPIRSSSDVNGVIGSDGQKYIVDMHRITPRDANYPDPVKHFSFVVRESALKNFQVMKTLQQHHDELVQLGGNPKRLYSGNNEELHKKRSEYLNDLKKVSFDINSLTPDSSVQKPTNDLIELATFIKEVLIAQFIEEYFIESQFINSGSAIVSEMHGRGINVRYLGEIAKELSSKPESVVTASGLLLVETEILIRSFKVYVRKNNLSLPRFIDQLNLLLSSANNNEEKRILVSQLTEIGKFKFSYTIRSLQSCQRTLLLKGILSSFGISIHLNPADSHISISDISHVSPKLKYSFYESPFITELIDFGTTCYQNGDYTNAEQMFLSAVSLSDVSINGMDKIIGVALFYLGLIYLGKNQSKTAYDFLIKSMIIQERYSDQLDQEIIIRYSVLSEACKQLGQKNMSFILAYRAFVLSALLYPTHPWTMKASSVAVENAYEANPKYAYNISVFYFELCEQHNMEASVLAQLCHQISMLCITIGFYSEAIKYAEKATKINPIPELVSSFEMIKNTYSNEKQPKKAKK